MPSELKTRISHNLHRLGETRRSFENWPSLIKDIALGRAGFGPETLEFRTRSGVAITCPNQRGAIVPAYEIFAEDSYHLEWFLGEMLRRPITVIDIGSHVGTFTCQLASANPEARFTCFEPSSTTARFLRQNVERNGFADRVTITEAAVAGTTGTAVFQDNGAASGHNGLVGAIDQTIGRHVEVPTVAFDEVVRRAGGHVDVVKMDCEGGEYDLVYNSDPQSWSTVSRVVLEYHLVPDQSWTALASWFGNVGLDVVKVESSKEGFGAAWLSRSVASASTPSSAGGGVTQ